MNKIINDHICVYVTVDHEQFLREFPSPKQVVADGQSMLACGEFKQFVNTCIVLIHVLYVDPGVSMITYTS